jgi:tRNA G37 N-methylase Trm5
VEACRGLGNAMSVGMSNPGTSVLLNRMPTVQRVLPADVEVPTSFETVGHIAHFNLRPEQLPYRKIIGQVRPRSRQVR